MWTKLCKAQHLHDKINQYTTEYTILLSDMEEKPPMHLIVKVSHEMALNKLVAQFLATATILAIYCPKALFGSKIGNRKRAEMAHAIGCSPTYISKQKGLIIMQYNTNGRIRLLLNEIAAKLKEAGYIL